MKLSDAISIYLKNRGIEVVFGYQGGSITHMIDSFVRMGIKYVQTYNEQGAGLAADAYARTSKLGLGVAIGTNGPGATNLITAIANAYCDSVPVLFFTGQVHSFAMRQNNKIRQESFQEIDIIAIVKSITKYAVTILDKNIAISEIEKAMNIAKSGRKGPVLIDLPVDIQGENVDDEILNKSIHKKEVFDKKNNVETSTIRDVLNLLYSAKKPIILCGGGVRQAGAEEEFRKFVHNTGIPVVCSLMGLDVLNQKDDLFIGFIGNYGNRFANITLQNADFIIVLGSRLDIRQTGKKRDLFASQAHIIHVDIDKMELGHFINRTININADLLNFILMLNEEIKTQQKNIDLTGWYKEIYDYKKKYPDVMEYDYQFMNPNFFLKELSKMMKDNSIICCDVGQNQMWVAQSLRIEGNNIRVLNSGGLGTMGYALPSTIGAYYANPNGHIIGMMGDGGLQMNIQELELIGYYQMPIVIFIFNNHALGLIRDVHEKYYDNRCYGSVIGFSMPNLKKLARAYRFAYVKISSLRKLKKLKLFLDIPQIVEVDFKEDTYVKPELLGKDPLDRQIPYR